MFDLQQQQTLTTILQHYQMPRTYLVLDTETSGFSFDRDVIVDVGWVIVEHGVLKCQQNRLLDWSRMPGANCDYIRSQLDKQAVQYAQIGRPHYYSWDRLCTEGEDPRAVLYDYANLIYAAIEQRVALVGHGLWWFDRKMIDSHTFEYLQSYYLPWQYGAVIDTGLIEKAIQLGVSPEPAEPLADWLRRVDNCYAKGVKWSMESHCVEKYQLYAASGMSPHLLHTAGFDCLLIHTLFQTYQRLAIHG